MLLMGEDGFNFVYCQRPKHLERNLEVLEILQSSADYAVWICLAVILLMTTWLIKHGIEKDFSDIMLTISFVLISPRMSGTCGDSKLFLLLTFVCLVFVTFYSGELVSVMIKPAAEERIASFEKFRENNYTLFYENSFTPMLA